MNEEPITREMFLAHLAARKPLAVGTPMHDYMSALSQEALRITAQLNGGYHTPAELRALMSELVGAPLDESFSMFPPFHTDCGKNLHIGKHVFFNAGCTFQDQGGIFIGDGTLIGYNVVMVTLNHEIDPTRRHIVVPAPIHIGKNVWIAANATILAGVTIGENAVVAAGSVVTKDVAPNTVVAGVPAKCIRTIEESGE